MGIRHSYTSRCESCGHPKTVDCIVYGDYDGDEGDGSTHPPEECGVCELVSRAEKAEAERDELKAEVERLRGALTPSSETKADYMGEVSYNVSHIDEFGDDIQWEHFVPWTAIKDIMRMILRKAQKEQG